ncbi:MAG: MerR family transcriptional regulator [Rubrobacteraceae bacterium]
MRTSEAAAKLGVSPQYLRLLEAEGRVPAVSRVCGFRVYTKADITRLKAAGVGSPPRRLKRVEEALKA